MGNEINNEIDKICIEKYSSKGYGEVVIEDPTVLNNLINLI